MPKVGEYWHLNVPIKIIDFSGNSCREYYPTIAKCISVTEKGPVFYGNALIEWRNVYYGGGFYDCQVIAKWEPNWFWKLLGYK